jgi:hypothetical protein
VSYPRRVDIHRNTVPKVGTVWTAYDGLKAMGFQATLGELLPIFPHADVYVTSAEARDIVSAYPDAKCVGMGVG